MRKESSDWRTLERKDWKPWASLTEGTFILRCNVDDWSPEELWRTHVQMCQAEAALLIHESE